MIKSRIAMLYLIDGAEAVQAPVVANIVPAAQGLGAAHQALLQGGGPTGFQPYKRPEMFGPKVIGGF